MLCCLLSKQANKNNIKNQCDINNRTIEGLAWLPSPQKESAQTNLIGISSVLPKNKIIFLNTTKVVGLYTCFYFYVKIMEKIYPSPSGDLPLLVSVSPIAILPLGNIATIPQWFKIIPHMVKQQPLELEYFIFCIFLLAKQLFISFKVPNINQTKAVTALLHQF